MERALRRADRAGPHRRATVHYAEPPILRSSCRWADARGHSRTGSFRYGSGFLRAKSRPQSRANRSAVGGNGSAFRAARLRHCRASQRRKHPKSLVGAVRIGPRRLSHGPEADRLRHGPRPVTAFSTTPIRLNPQPVPAHRGESRRFPSYLGVRRRQTPPAPARQSRRRCRPARASTAASA